MCGCARSVESNTRNTYCQEASQCEECIETLLYVEVRGGEGCAQQREHSSRWNPRYAMNIVGNGKESRYAGIPENFGSSDDRKIVAEYDVGLDGNGENRIEE